MPDYKQMVVTMTTKLKRGDNFVLEKLGTTVLSYYFLFTIYYLLLIEDCRVGHCNLRFFTSGDQEMQYLRYG